MGHGGRDTVVLAILHSELGEGTAGLISRVVIGIGHGITSGSDTGSRTILVGTRIQRHGELRSDLSTHFVVAHLRAGDGHGRLGDGGVLLRGHDHIEDLLHVLAGGIQGLGTSGTNGLDTDVGGDDQVLVKVNVVGVVVAIGSFPLGTIVYVGSVAVLVVSNHTLDDSDVTFLGRTDGSQNGSVLLFPRGSQRIHVVFSSLDQSANSSLIGAGIVQLSPGTGAIANLVQAGIAFNTQLAGLQNRVVGSPVLGSVVGILQTSIHNFFGHVHYPPLTSDGCTAI